MDFRRKSISAVLLITALVGLHLLFGFYILYANRFNIPWLKQRFQIVQWSPDDSQLLGPNNHRIYFHETSGRSRLTLRQSCAVESAAKENPERPIQLIMQTKRSSIDKYGTWLAVLAHYPNVAVVLINETEYFQNTPLEEWYRKGEWRQSPHKLEHFSDYIRMLTNLKGGGLYMDLDFVTLKSLDVKNFLAIEDVSANSISNGIFHLDHGHHLIRDIVKMLAARYQPTEWNAHGPALILSVMATICGLKKGEPLSNECSDVALMPYNFVYPIHWPDWRIYFQRASRNVMQWINGSFAIHVWNKMSHSEPLLLGSDQVYSTLASKHCPLTVARAEEFVSA